MIQAQSHQSTLPTPVWYEGKVLATKGGMIQAQMPSACLGAICEIESASKEVIHGQIIAIQSSSVLIAPFSPPDGLKQSTKVRASNLPLSVVVPADPRGFVLGSFGNILHRTSNTQSYSTVRLKLNCPAINPLDRLPITDRLDTGIRTIDSCVPVGKGQRIGIMAPAGTGKTTLLESLVNLDQTAIPVICLVGERGREINEFVNFFQESGKLAGAVFVVSSSDESAVNRKYGAYTATAIAEYLRAQGKDVLLLVDSVTRIARAMRELSLLAGELPVRQGFTASVYSELPRLLERPGTTSEGSITAFYTNLCSEGFEGDALTEEITSILDGQIILSKDLAQDGIYPAVDLHSSLSRLITKLLCPDELKLVNRFKKIVSKLHDDKELALLGMIAEDKIEHNQRLEKCIREFQIQTMNESSDRHVTFAKLEEIISQTTWPSL